MRVAIDAGHGMSNRQPGVFDPGVVHVESGVRFREADIMLDYALALRDAFYSRGAAVFLTRSGNDDPAPFMTRAGRAERARCHALISLHLNNGEVEPARGLEVHFRDDDGRRLARDLQANLTAVTGFTDRGVRESGHLAVLQFKGPAALVELGFLANDEERRVLTDASMRNAICITMADSLLSVVR